jgi:hypothetical protein
MGVRSKYKSQVAAEKAAEHAPVVVSPAAAEGHPTVAIGVHVDPVAEAQAKSDAADSATARLKEQIEALHQAEHMQRNPREAKLHLWRQQGMDEPTERFLRDNPALIDHDQLTSQIAQQAARHHPPGTDQHREAVKAIFNDLMGKAEAERLARNAPQPPPQAPPHHEPAVHVHVTHEGDDMPNSDGPAFDRRIHSAPIDRDAAGSRGNAPGKVTLSAEERSFARQIGLSETEYARQKGNLREYKRTRGDEFSGR